MALPLGDFMKFKFKYEVMIFIVNLLLIAAIVFTRSSIYDRVEEFGDYYDADYQLLDEVIHRIEVDEVGNEFARPGQRFRFIGREGAIYYELGQPYKFYNEIMNLVTTLSMGYMVAYLFNLTGIYYYLVNKLKPTGFILNSFTTLYMILGYDFLEAGYKKLIVIFFITSLFSLIKRKKRVRKVNVKSLDEL